MPTKKLRGFPPTTNDMPNIRDVYSGSKIPEGSSEPDTKSDGDVDDVYGMGRGKIGEGEGKKLNWDKLGN